MYLYLNFFHLHINGNNFEEGTISIIKNLLNYIFDIMNIFPRNIVISYYPRIIINYYHKWCFSLYIYIYLSLSPLCVAWNCTGLDNFNETVQFSKTCPSWQHGYSKLYTLIMHFNFTEAMSSFFISPLFMLFALLTILFLFISSNVLLFSEYHIYCETTTLVFLMSPLYKESFT